MSRFGGKTGIVTGAASGIGRASAQALAREGAWVLVCDIDAEGGAETVRLIEQEGGGARFRRLDVADETEVHGAIGEIVDEHGHLDLAHNNAGVVGPAKRVADTSREEWEQVMAVNLTGVFLCMKYEIAQMEAQGTGGAIVNTSSISGLGASPLMAAYTASKHGVTGLTRVAGYDYAKRGIRVNALCPGVTHTPMIDQWIDGDPVVQAVMDASVPIGRMATPEEMAEAVVWLCSDSASFVTGVALPVDGGLTSLAGGGASDEEAGA
jgi:NAD(P)-dependent dehydrogenase (short-subunit alcohol dehydrogenase family)